MLSEPNISRQALIDALEASYGLSVRSLIFLPIGADTRSFSYDCYTHDNSRLYLKLRLDEDSFSQVSSASMYVARHVEGAIHPLTTNHNDSTQLQFGSYKAVLYPFVNGVAGWRISLAPTQWEQIGRTFRSLHELVLPDSVKAILPREAFSNKWRVLATKYLNAEVPVLADDSCASTMKGLLKTNHGIISDIIEKAQELSALLLNEQLEFVCCHGDLHSGNFLVTDTGFAHPVDWDNLSLAPREKDLMFIGGGVGGMLDGPNARELFDRGYGSHQLSLAALRYFRFERIVQDVVAFCEQLLDSEDGGPDRQVSLEHFARQFTTGAVVDIAYRT